ncbi:MAG: hypothetical protein HY264_04300 [Chloroflexi bacterium]|nr:hypothetical protein [Chloroflexota bacterium]
MIVVCGSLEPIGRHEGPAVALAERAAWAGASVQVIGIVPDGPSGDRRLIELGAAGVGHAAVLRSTARALEPADVDLALRYLPDIRVVVDASGAATLHATLAEGATYAGASFILIGDVSAPAPAIDLPDSAIVLQAPTDDPDGTFAGFVGAFAARLDGGAVPADAWAATVRALAVDPVTAGPGRRSRAADD